MIALIRGVFAGLVILASAQAQAGFIDLGRTTVDESTRLEWLDLTETRFQAYDLTRFYVTSHIGIGAEGWRFANIWDFTVLVRNFFGPGLHYGPGDNVFEQAPFFGAYDNPQVEQFISLFGDTLAASAASRPGDYEYFVSGGAYGFVDDALLAGILDVEGADDINGYLVQVPDGVYERPFDYYDRIVVNGPAPVWSRYSGVGSWLVRSYVPEPSGVPEPSSLALIALGLAGLGATRRRKSA